MDASSVVGNALTLNLSSDTGNVQFKGGADGNTITAGAGTESLDMSASTIASNTIDLTSIYAAGNTDGNGNITHTLSVTGFKTGGTYDTLRFNDPLNLSATDDPAGQSETIAPAGSINMTASNGIVSFGGANLSGASLNAVLGAVESFMMLETGVVAFQFNGSTYVVAYNINLVTETVVKLAGLTGVTGLDVNSSPHVAGHIAIS